MSIASEIQDLNTNLTNAKNAVTAKGGTVGDTGLAGLAAEIATIPGSQPEPPTSSEAHLTAYDSSTGVITGENLGTTAGTIYMLDRDTHTYIAQPTSSWTNTSVTLTTPLDLANLQGTTSIVAVLPSGMWSTKLLVTGQVAVPGWGVVYRQDPDTRAITKITLESSTDLNQLIDKSGSVAITLDGNTYYSDEIVGFQFGSSYNLNYVDNKFLYGFKNLNQPISVPSTAQTIGVWFLRACSSFNQPVSIPSTITTINTYFLQGCGSFNQPIILPDGITSIYDNFLAYDYSFAQPIAIPDEVTSIGVGFLRYCYSFNQPLTIPSTVTTIGDYFLAYSLSFNQPLTIPDSVTSIGEYFVSGYNNSADSARHMAFNNSIKLPSELAVIPKAFLAYCDSFNQPLTIPSTVTTIGDQFLYGDYAFDQPLTLPNGLVAIGSYFMGSCSAFNQPLTIPSTVTTIDNNFLGNCGSFNCPLTIPSSVTSITAPFLYADPSFSSLEVNTTAYPTGNQVLSYSNTTAKVYAKGVTLTGTGASTWLANLPNRTSTPYRKLIDGTV